MNRLSRKRRTREHIIADLSINHVERHALLGGFVIDRIFQDYGIDLELQTFNKNGEVQEGKVSLQVKASDRLRLRPQQKAWEFRIERRDLAFWLAQPMPVMLIIYDARNDVAHWLYIQSCFRQQKEFNIFAAGKTLSVFVPVANVVTSSAMRTFARFRDRVLNQMGEVIHEEV